VWKKNGQCEGNGATATSEVAHDGAIFDVGSFSSLQRIEQHRGSFVESVLAKDAGICGQGEFTVANLNGEVTTS
jgi:hypothetical protein